MLRRLLQHRFTLLVALLAGAFGLYLPSLHLPFFPDDLALAELFHPAGPLDWGEVPKILWPSKGNFNFHNHLRPLGWLSALLDDALFGLHPEAFRAVGIGLHALNSWLVGLLAGALITRRRALHRSFAALAFLLSPLAVEPVVWVCHRFTLLSTTFFLLAALGTLQIASKKGRALTVFWLCLAGLLSKDSLLSQCFVLAPFAFCAGRGSRWRAFFLALKATSAAVAVDLLLRRWATGAWLPSYEEGGDILSTLSLNSLASRLPGTFRIFLSGSGGLDASPWIAWVALAAAAALLVLGVSKRSGLLASAALLLGLLGASLPVLAVTDDLAGARQLYLPGAALAIVFARGAAASRVGIVLGGIFAATLLIHHLGRQEAYVEAGRRVESLVHHIDGIGRPEDRVVVLELEASHRGAPVFGLNATHLHIRFLPVLHTPPRDVRGGSPDDFAMGFSGDRPTHLLACKSLEAGIRIPGEGEAPSRLLSLLSPASGAFWPSPGTPFGAALVFEAPPGLEAFRVILECESLRADLILKVSDQGGLVRKTSKGKSLLVIPALGLHPLLPSADLPALLRLASGPARPARIKVEELPKAGASRAGAATPWQSFQLGRRP